MVEILKAMFLREMETDRPKAERFPTSSKPRTRAKRFSVSFRGTTPTPPRRSGSWILTGELRKLCTCLAFALYIRKSGSLIHLHKVLSWSCLLRKMQKPRQGSILAGQGKNYMGLPSKCSCIPSFPDSSLSYHRRQM